MPVVNRKPPPLHPEERAALDYAKRQGGKLHRNDVGWGPAEFEVTRLEEIFAREIVRGLVARGMMRWSLHERTRTGSSVPIEAELVEAAA